MKFYDVVGYGESVKTAPGVWSDVITERKYRGNVYRNTRQVRESTEKVNNDISVGNSISIVADAYANENFMAIRYIKWAGVYWIVSKVDVQTPRLILELGGVYNGSKASPSDTP